MGQTSSTSNTKVEIDGKQQTTDTLDIKATTAESEIKSSVNDVMLNKVINTILSIKPSESDPLNKYFETFIKFDNSIIPYLRFLIELSTKVKLSPLEKKYILEDILANDILQSTYDYVYCEDIINNTDNKENDDSLFWGIIVKDSIPIYPYLQRDEISRENRVIILNTFLNSFPHQRSDGVANSNMISDTFEKLKSLGYLKS